MTAQFSRQLYILMGLLLTLFFFGNLDVQIISPILPALTESFNISVFLAGFSVSAYSISGAFWALIIGPLSDRHGRIVFLRIAAIAFAIAAAMAFGANHYGMFVLARIVAGFAGGSFTACIIAQIADLFPYQRRGRAMGVVGAVYSLAAVVGVPVGAVMAANYGWRSIYVFFSFAALVMALFLGKRAQRAADKFSAQNVDAPKKPDQSDQKPIHRIITNQVNEYWQFWSTRQTRDGLLVALSIAATSTSLMTFLGAWLADGFGLRGSAVAFVFLAAGISTVLGSVLGGFLADKIGKRRLVIACSLIITFVLLSTAFVQTVSATYGFCVTGGLFIAMRQGPYEAILTELVPQHQRGAYIAMRSTIAKLAIAATAAIAGYLYDISGFVAVTAFSSLASLGAAALMHFSFLETQKAVHSPNLENQLSAK